MGNASSSSRRHRQNLHSQPQEPQSGPAYPPPAVQPHVGSHPLHPLEAYQSPHCGHTLQAHGQYNPGAGAYQPRPPAYQNWHPHPPPQQQYPGAAPLMQGQPNPQAPQELTQTATIRNAVNLKKNSLQLVPLEGSPSRRSIHFVFDASTACRLTTFVLASEETAEGCRLVPHAGACPKPVYYPKGLGHAFPTPGAPEADQAVLDLAQLDEKQLSGAVDGVFPLVFRLETVSDAGVKEGHTLQELQPGDRQQMWVQSQTTFASVAKNEDGQHICKVLKQKIWVEGVSYELQEIYGMDHTQRTGPRAQAEREEDIEERLCVICLVNDRDTTVLPCRHMCMCHECAQELRKQTSKCPICRNHVESLLHIKMQKRLTREEVNAAVAASGGDAAKMTDEFQKLQAKQSAAPTTRT